MKPTTPFASNIHRRFRPEGKIVARRPLTAGREYQVGEEVPEAELDARRRWLLWEQAWIDTPEPEEPSDAELEQLTAPAQKSQPQTKQPQARR